MEGILVAVVGIVAIVVIRALIGATKDRVTKGGSSFEFVEKVHGHLQSRYPVEYQAMRDADSHYLKHDWLLSRYQVSGYGAGAVARDIVRFWRERSPKTPKAQEVNKMQEVTAERFGEALAETVKPRPDASVYDEVDPEVQARELWLLHYFTASFHTLTRFDGDVQERIRDSFGERWFQLAEGVVDIQRAFEDSGEFYNTALNIHEPDENLAPLMPQVQKPSDPSEQNRWYMSLRHAAIARVFANRCGHRPDDLFAGMTARGYVNALATNTLKSLNEMTEGFRIV